MRRRPQTRQKRPVDKTPRDTTITALTHDGRGIGRREDGKVIFINGALPGETVRYVEVENRRKFSIGSTLEILQASEHRVAPKCPVYDRCGGCVLQHLDPNWQIHHKQQNLLDNFQRIGGLQPETIIPAMMDTHWNYRRRAKFSVQLEAQTDTLAIGFKEHASSRIQATDSCDIVHPEISALLPAVRNTLQGLEGKRTISHIEFCVADNATAMIIGHTNKLAQDDLSTITRFARDNQLELFLQTDKSKTIVPVNDDIDGETQDTATPLFYEFTEFAIKVEFLPTDFIQVNANINEQLVSQAIELLDIQSDDNVLDLFSGVGNFTLPLARKAHHVIGVEGEQSLVDRAKHNKELNQLEHVNFFTANLFTDIMTANSNGEWFTQSFDKILLDPPRAGAMQMIKHLDRFKASKVVYVSCDPATLARDAKTMVNDHGYHLAKAGVIDMFPQTAHVESIAVFEKR
ncbi:MAG: 23S rRNA (uracil(1939)-C(5))-methyltransferase RlmD [Arenicella sp.]